MTTATTERTRTTGTAQRFDRRAVSYCDIWDLVAPGEQCPACADNFHDRLAKAAGSN